MGKKVPPGLIRRGEVWHIKKTIHGRRVQESTGTSDLAEAERYLAHRIEEIRNAVIYGVRPHYIWREAATRYLREADKASLVEDARQLKYLDPYIGHLQLEAVHMGSLQKFIEDRKQQGVKNRTVNAGLEVVRHILRLAAGEWLDDRGRSWLHSAPRIRLLRQTDKREPYPLSWSEQERLFAELPPYLHSMGLFLVNTGCREQEACQLRWDWEVDIPELNTSVFIIPREKVKNREDRVVILNSTAAKVVEDQRGLHPEFVFLNSQGRPVQYMCREAWRKARIRAGLPDVRVHDLKHTFGRRLRSAGVSFEDRQDLLGHKSGRITTHYSAPELINLVQAAERVCGNHWCKSGAMVVLRRKNLALVSSNQAR
ncbi:MAG: site-specific integrase [Thermodesulfobacteriota bacterium]